MKFDSVVRDGEQYIRVREREKKPCGQELSCSLWVHWPIEDHLFRVDLADGGYYYEFSRLYDEELPHADGCFQHRGEDEEMDAHAEPTYAENDVDYADVFDHDVVTFPDGFDDVVWRFLQKMRGHGVYGPDGNIIAKFEYYGQGGCGE